MLTKIDVSNNCLGGLTALLKESKIPKCPQCSAKMKASCLMKTPPAYDSFECDGCENGRSDARWFCDKCQADLCYTCTPVVRRPMGIVVLADGLRTNKSVQQLDVSSNAMGTACAKIFGDMLLANKTLQTLDVSDNSFGKVQVGDEVKLRSGKMKVVEVIYDDSDIQFEGSKGWTKASEYKLVSQVPAFCAGVAASPSLILLNVSSNSLDQSSKDKLAKLTKQKPPQLKLIQ